MEPLTAAQGIGLLSARIRTNFEVPEKQCLVFTKYPANNVKNLLYVNFTSFQEAKLAYDSIIGKYPDLGADTGFSPQLLQKILYSNIQAQQDCSTYLVLFESTYSYSGYVL